jgi:hypothetical protein
MTVNHDPNFEGIRKMHDKPEDKAKLKCESLQLQRLERMVDVVYAIIIWRAFTLLPRPTAEQLSWEHIGAFLSANIGSLVMVIIGIVSHRAVCASIERSNSGRTDHRHHYSAMCVFRSDHLGDILV